MVIVIAMSVFIMAMMMAGAAMAVNSLGMSRQRNQFERALASAEAGIDQTFAELQAAYDTKASDFPVPSPASAVCAASAVGPWVTGGATEELWAANTLNSLASAHPECIVTTESGQYLVLKPESPPGYGRVYALGWSPGRGDPGASSRLVKAEYVLLPYAPKHAILTAGSLHLDSSTTVGVANGFDGLLSGVHANGVITTTGNPTVSGPVTSAGVSTASSNRFQANPGGAVTRAPTVAVPRVNARSFYFNAPNSDGAAVTNWWYDLCPDGSVHAWSSAGPCTGAVNQSAVGIGWTYASASHTWTATRNTVSGVFYVHEGNTDVGTGNTTIPNITVIASATSGSCATRQYGNITWNHYDMSAPAFHNLFLYADSDLRTGSNFSAGNRGSATQPVVSGMFVAGDQIAMETSSQGAVGSVIAADRCTNSPLVTVNEVKNPSIYFDPEGDSPFTDIITTTLWLEYNTS